VEKAAKEKQEEQERIAAEKAAEEKRLQQERIAAERPAKEKVLEEERILAEKKRLDEEKRAVVAPLTVLICPFRLIIVSIVLYFSLFLSSPVDCHVIAHLPFLFMLFADH
jgi:Flp pilus assembly protein TadB